MTDNTSGLRPEDLDRIWETNPEQAIRRAMAVVRPGYRMWTGFYIVLYFGLWVPSGVAALLAFANYSHWTVGILAAVGAACGIVVAQYDPKQEATRYMAATQYCWMARNAYMQHPESNEGLELVRQAINVTTPDVRLVFGDKGERPVRRPF